MNKILVLLSTFSIMFLGAAESREYQSHVGLSGLSGEYGISSDYMWRGVSQSDGKPSVYACADQAIAQGFYVGGCASSIDFNNDSKVELDLYGGYSLSKGKFSMDVGYVSYRYHKEDSMNFEEKYIVLGYDALSIGHASGMHDALDYDWVDLKVPFIDFADVTLHYGDYDGVKDKSINIEYALSDAMSLGVLIQSNVQDDHVAIGDAVSLHFKTVF